MTRSLGAALLLAALAVPACTRPVSPTDAGSDSGSDAGERDAYVADAGPGDAGPDGGVTGALSVVGGLGARGGAIPVSGALSVVDDGFDVGAMSCSGVLCAYGGFR